MTIERVRISHEGVFTPNAGLSSIEVETYSWARVSEEIKSLLQLFTASDESAVVQNPAVEKEVWANLCETTDEGLEDEGEEENGEGVSLLRAGGTFKAMVAKEKVRGVAVAKLDPGRQLWAMLPRLLQHLGSVYGIESVFHIYLENPFLVDWDGCVIEDGVSGVDKGLATPSHSNAELMRSEVSLCVLYGFPGEAFGCPATKSLANRNRAMATCFFVGRKEVCST